METQPLPVPAACPAPAQATDRLVAAFLAGRNPRTLRAYSCDLEDFRLFASALSVTEAARQLLGRGPGPANALALDYKAHLTDRGLSTATVNRRLAALRSLVHLARTLGMVGWSLEVQNARHQPYRDTRGPGRPGFRRLWRAAATRKDAKSARDRAMLRLLYDLALRRGEVVSLDTDHVDLVENTIAVLGKGQTARTKLTLPEPTQAALAAWLDVRGPDPGPLFVNFDRAGKGRRLTCTSLYRIVRGLGRKAGLEVRPHGLRHAAITEALDLTDGNVRAVQRFSRHRSLQVLTLYDDNRRDLGGEVARLVAERV